MRLGLCCHRLWQNGQTSSWKCLQVRRKTCQAAQFSAGRKLKSLLTQGVSYSILAACAAASCWHFSPCVRKSEKENLKPQEIVLSLHKDCSTAIPPHCCNKTWCLEQKDDEAAEAIVIGISFCCLTEDVSRAFQGVKSIWTTPLITHLNCWSALKYLVGLDDCCRSLPTKPLYFILF